MRCCVRGRLEDPVTTVGTPRIGELHETTNQLQKGGRTYAHRRPTSSVGVLQLIEELAELGGVSNGAEQRRQRALVHHRRVVLQTIRDDPIPLGGIAAG